MVIWVARADNLLICRGRNSRSAAVSSILDALAEIIRGTMEAISPTTRPLLKLFSQALSDDVLKVHSKTAFAIGIVVERSTVDLSPQYLARRSPSALRGPVWRTHFSDIGNLKLNARENAAIVLRVILKKSKAIPLDQDLPVLVGILPPKNDFLKNSPVLRTLFHLLRSAPGVLTPYLVQLLLVSAHILDPFGPDQIGDKVGGELVQLVRALNAENLAKIQAAGLTAINR